MTGRWRLRACDRVGAEPRVDGRVDIRNYGRIVIGDHLRLSSRPVRSQMVCGPSGTLSIGSRVKIAHGASIAAHLAVTIGDDVSIGPFLQLMDTNFHDVKDYDKPGKERPVVIGAGVRIGARVVILPGTWIGRDAQVASGSVVSGYVPERVAVSGVPARWELSMHPMTVRAVIRELFGLGVEPPIATPMRDIPGWGALSALRLVLVLEHQFGIHLDAEAVSSAKRIGAIEAEVADAMGGALVT